MNARSYSRLAAHSLAIALRNCLLVMLVVPPVLTYLLHRLEGRFIAAAGRMDCKVCSNRFQTT